MEAIYLVCGARRPQLKRDPLGRCRFPGGFLKYLRQDVKGAWQWEPYRAYLEQIRDRLPPQVAAFATPFVRHSLDSPHSLHDAWLESLEVMEPAKGKRHEQRSTRITLRLLGAFHDRVHELVYLGVRRYRVEALDGEQGHGDLVVHEVRIEDRPAAAACGGMPNGGHLSCLRRPQAAA